jgi:hypothetical protein
MANNPNHKENLKNFEKGFDERRNTDGRPEGVRNRSTIARRVLEMDGIVPEKVFNTLKAMYPAIERKMSVEEIATIIQANKAITKSDTQALEKLMDSAYGKAPQSVKVGGDEETPLQINLTNGLSFKEAYQLKYGKLPDDSND